MALRNTFNSSENKQILWEFMEKNKFFNNIHSSKNPEIRGEFERKIHEIDKENTGILNVVELNKKFISSMLPIFNKMRNSSRKVSFTDAVSIPAHAINNMSDKNVITAQENQQRRQDIFNKKLEDRQNEFKQMIKTNIPTHVDFSDNTKDDDGHITNMDERMTDIMTKRENDIKSMFTDPPPADIHSKTSSTNSNKLENNQKYIPGAVIGKQQLPSRKSLQIGKDIVVNDIIMLPGGSSTQLPRNNDKLYNLLESIQGDIKKLKEGQQIISERLETIKIV